ncbi:MAG: phospho-N-acetylmuramoyl-pentapeptide-transferase, partial [Micromonosporaceae bacterium]|nr:phospho-N-acetylmuramoyl-pentapeptide-transferase [Micromonosporaceae bacterium]
MRSVIVAAFVAFAFTLFFTPIAIKFFRRLKVGQPIRELGPATHQGKQGTPTMGGVVFILATVIAYIAGHVALVLSLPPTPTRPYGPTVTGMVLLGLFVFTGLVGFIDDYLKVRKRNSLGLNERGKLIGLLMAGIGFGVVAMYFPNHEGVTVGSEYVSFVKDVDWLHIGKVGAIVVFAFVVISASNGVNLTDGLDGLATGSSMMVLTAYSVIGFWQYRHVCGDSPTEYCYQVRDPLEIALIAGAAVGALFGFLWWNASPAKIFMGDSGALGLGGLIGGLAMATKTIMLLPILGALFVIVTMSVIIQRISYKSTGRRVFRMAPLQHHFELVGWTEVNIVIRFWIVCGIGVAIGLGFFYADFLAAAG